MPSGVYAHHSNQGFQPGSKIWLGKKLTDEHRKKLCVPHGQSSFKGKSYEDIYGDDWAVQVEKRRAGRAAHFDRVGRKPKLRTYRNSFLYYEFTRRIFERDDFTCQACGTRGGELHADHYPVSFIVLAHRNLVTTYEEAQRCASLWDISNGRTLCAKCHRQTPSYGKHLVYQLRENGQDGQDLQTETACLRTVQAS